MWPNPQEKLIEEIFNGKLGFCSETQVLLVMKVNTPTIVL